ncbi:MAG TPA: biopolymer transporter ExbD [Polyangia bacterium]|nr:biopolymer transporter ExbD [Polyangia bacterium]
MQKRPPIFRAPKRVLRPEINVTPLVDVVLVLLIIFMVIAPQLEAGERVELPTIQNVERKSKLQAMTLTVTISGRYLLEKDVVDPTRVEETLTDEHKKSPDKRLVVKADKGVTYGKMRTLFASAKKIGFPGVALMVDERGKTANP